MLLFFIESKSNAKDAEKAKGNVESVNEHIIFVREKKTNAKDVWMQRKIRLTGKR